MITSSLTQGLTKGIVRGLTDSAGVARRSITDALSSVIHFWDATNPDSYDGTGQTVYDLVGDLDLIYGTTTGAESTDPTFTGTAGSRDAYWNWNTGDLMTASANNDFLNQIHRTDFTRSFTFFACVYLNVHTVNQAIMSTRTGSSPGLTCQWTASEFLNLIQRGDSANASLSSTEGNVTPGEYFVLISHNASTNNTYFAINSLTSGATHTFNTCVNNASLVMQIGGGLINGNRLRSFGFADAFIGDAEEEALREFLEENHNQNYTRSLLTIGAGQSNISRHFTVAGETTFEGLIDNYYRYYNYENGALGGAGLTELSNGTNYYISSTTDQPGTAYNGIFTTALGNLTDLPNWIVWGQGETVDASEDHQSSLAKLFEYIRENVNPDIKIMIQPIGKRTDASSSDTLQQKVRDAQIAVANSLSDYVFLGPEVYDLTLDADGLHYASASYTTMCSRNANFILSTEGKIATWTLPPYIASATFTAGGTTITVTLAHDGGDDFTPSSGIEGFRVTDDGVDLTISSAVRTDGETITLTSSTTIAAGSVVKLWYAYGKMASVNTANIVKDNSINTLAMRACSNLTVTQV